MADPILKRFTVEGRGAFPFDLCRVDRCWPASPHDAAMIAASDPGSPSRRVVLETAAKYAPDRRRWQMAAWKVAD